MRKWRDDDKDLCRGLVAMDAKYHRDCFRRYTAAASSSKSTGGDKNIHAEYDSAFLRLIIKIEQKLVKKGRAYDMATLSGMYKRHLADSGMEKAVVDTYRDLFNTTAKKYNSINSTREINLNSFAVLYWILQKSLTLLQTACRIALMGTKVYL